MTVISSLVEWQPDREPDYRLRVDMPLFSKARPRLCRTGGAYMPPEYKQAQRLMRDQLKEQWKQEPLEGPLALCLDVYGEGRGDNDNIAGAFMDAAGPVKNGVGGILWNDDRVSIIPYLSIRWHKAPKVDSAWIASIWLLE